MPPLLRRVLLGLSALGVVACCFGVLAGLLLAFGPFVFDLPIRREEALRFAVLAGAGLVLSGTTLGWLGRKLDRA